MTDLLQTVAIVLLATALVLHVLTHLRRRG